MNENENMSASLVPVNFHGDQLFLVEHNGQPYVPMRRVVENIGLDWSSQRVKLQEGRLKRGVAIITTPSKQGTQQTLCLSLRKLPAWLMSISPNKVAPHLREKIELYQEECDEVLWQYWSSGQQPVKDSHKDRTFDALEELLKTNRELVKTNQELVARSESNVRYSEPLSPEAAEGYKLVRGIEALCKPMKWPKTEATNQSLA